MLRTSPPPAEDTQAQCRENLRIALLELFPPRLQGSRTRSTPHPPSMTNTVATIAASIPIGLIKSLSMDTNADTSLGRSGSNSSQVGYLNKPLSATSGYNSDHSAGPSSSMTHVNPPPPPPPPPKHYRQATLQDSGNLHSDAGARLERHPSDMLRTLANYENHQTPLELHEEQPLDEYWEDEEDEDENRFINFSLLSHIAVQLRDKVPRSNHTKGGVDYDRTFTGKEVVNTIQQQIQRELAINHGMSTNDRRAALQVARSLQSQLFFCEVEWDSRPIQDKVEDLYKFMSDFLGGEGEPEQEELPTGVGNLTIDSTLAPEEAQPASETWAEKVGPEVTQHLTETEINRQNIIHNLIEKEEQYVQDLDIVESDFIKPLRMANPSVVADDFIDEVFSNILDLRECNRRLVEVLYVRQREHGAVITNIGDIFLQAATEFRLAYPAYIGHYPIAEARLKEELDSNSAFKLFLEQLSRQSSRQESIRLNLKHFLGRPSEHLQKYPGVLDGVLKLTAEENIEDIGFLEEAILAIKNLQSVAQLQTFQSAMGRGTPGKWEWHDLVSTEAREKLEKKEAKRQSIIFELIKGEMAYVKDLENIEKMYIIPLRNADPPIIPRDRLEDFISDVFHNFAELYSYHAKLVKQFHRIQSEEHPVINSITEPLYDTTLNFRDAYLEYIPNYPIAAYRINEEMLHNPAFKEFVDSCVRHPDAHRLDMKSFINRPIPRLLRYELLLRGILEELPEGHPDLEAIPDAIESIKSLGKETEPGVFSAKQKVELWRYNSGLVFKSGEAIDMDLLDKNRSLIHSGKLLRQPESGLEWNGWSELFVLLFDNYLVMTKPKDKEGVVRYNVNRRPIPLDLLTVVNVSDPPTQRSTGLLRNLRGGDRHIDGAGPAPLGASIESANDSRSVYPITLHHNGRLGGPYILYAESAQARLEWAEKLQDAVGLRQAVQDSNKAFEVETISADTFLIPSVAPNAASPGWNQDSTYTGKVTCSVPFSEFALLLLLLSLGSLFTVDDQRHRLVVTLLRLAALRVSGLGTDTIHNALFAYHIEALVPSQPTNSRANPNLEPQKLNGTKDVHFFSVGQLHGRTLIVYMKKKGLESIFRVLEPVGDKINEKVKAPVGLSSRLGFRSAKSEWFRVYRDFFLPTESFDLIFLKARIVVLCAKGFEIMDLNDFNSVTIPLLDDPRMALAKRCESCRPMGMFRSKDDEFLLCYDGNRQAGTVEWEGTAERVAFHSPYVMIFDSRFIEVRDILTGRLVQIISGNDVRCIWDGRGVGTSVSVTSPGGIDNNGQEQEPQVHAVMTVDAPQGQGQGRPRVIAQRVVELIPTVPLFTPGPLNQNNLGGYPTDQKVGVGYQTQFAGSPPNSPDMARHSAAWR
ncbi:hypothetical protein DXG03_001036 [Asterophora parasitica]|uniref:Uncharacterized protein n=1 Tax=Asterophora parasitica TaxID=117018 RepID=A0A9P7G5R2_9AGAR|nr:hypothetical protein DXG03_001036 [Asterophora parasitica]